MSKKRVFILAKELAVSNEILIKTLKGMGFNVKSHMSALTPEMIKAIDEKFRGGKKKVTEQTGVEESSVHNQGMVGDTKVVEELPESVVAATEVETGSTETVGEERTSTRIIATEEKDKEVTTVEEISGTAKEPVSVVGKSEEVKILEQKEPKKPEEVLKQATETVTGEKTEIQKVKPKPETKVGKSDKEEPKSPPVHDKHHTVRLERSDVGIVEEVTSRGLTIRLESDEQIEEEKELVKPAKTASVGKKRVPIVKETTSKKTRKKRKRKRKHVDEAEILESVRKTIAEFDGHRKSKKRRKKTKETEEIIDTGTNFIKVSEFTTVSELALLLGKDDVEIISTLMKMGVMATKNQRLDMDTITMVADEYGVEVEEAEEFGEEIEDFIDEQESLEPRPPVVTVMGHVDHGKTSILDYFRNSNIVKGEAGGITQHIGAYTIETNNGLVSFIDTPGHEAFTSMRSRGSQITDIVVLVISADEGLKPQTIEAINHARLAEVPIIIAINKIDLPNANPEMVRRELAEQNILVEEWGGDYLCAEVSAKTGEGMDKLLELIHLQAEMLELKANPNRKANGVVIESKLDKGKGPVVSILVKGGTLKQGNVFVAGKCYGKVRALLDEKNRRMKSAGPSIPVQVLGCNGLPQAGDQLIVVKDEKEARKIASRRSSNLKFMEQSASSPKVTLEGLFDKMKDKEISEIPVIIKGDSIGSIEALTEAFEKMTTDEVRVNVIHKSAGAINESDVLLASASQALIIGYHIRPSDRAKELAAEEGVEIQVFDIIYKAIEAMQSALEGLLAPDMLEKAVGMAEVLQVYHIPKVGNIAGSQVKEGKIHRNDSIRIIRDGVMLGESTVSSLKRFKEDVKEVAAGYECGIGLDSFSDLRVGDRLEAFTIEEVKRTLNKGDS